MNERDMWWKIVIVGALVALALVSVHPLDQKIKFGIDLYGGYSLLYEIDDTGLNSADKADLSERVMKVLRERVDPKGVFNLVWRPVGHNRLEIQMPRPSEDIQKARADYEKNQEEIRKTVLRQSTILRALAKSEAERPPALAELAKGVPERGALLNEAAAAYDAYNKVKTDHDALVKKVEEENVSRTALLDAMKLPAAERPGAFEKFVRGVPQRSQLLADAAKAWDELQAAQAAQIANPPAGATSKPADVAAAKQQAFDAAVQKVLDTNVDPDKTPDGPTIDKVVDLEEKLNQAVAKVMATNLDIGPLQVVLDAQPGSKVRKEGQDKLTSQFPGLAALIDGLVKANDGLKKRRHGEGRLEDPADLQRLLRGAGVLEFRILADPAEMRSDPGKFAPYTEGLKNRGPRRLPGEENFQWFEIENPMDFFRFQSPEDLNLNFEARKGGLGVIAERYGDKYYVLAHIADSYTLTHRAGESDWSLLNAAFDRDRMGKPAIGFTLDERGGAKFAELTRLNRERQLAIFYRRLLHLTRDHPGRDSHPRHHPRLVHAPGSPGDGQEAERGQSAQEAEGSAHQRPLDRAEPGRGQPHGGFAGRHLRRCRRHHLHGHLLLLRRCHRRHRHVHERALHRRDDVSVGGHAHLARCGGSGPGRRYGGRRQRSDQ